MALNDNIQPVKEEEELDILHNLNQINRKTILSPKLMNARPENLRGATYPHIVSIV